MWGRTLALATAILSAAAFNLFHVESDPVAGTSFTVRLPVVGRPIAA